MGPINKQWYEERGLELWTYAAGRIDCRGEDLGQFGDEIGLSPMLAEDCCRFTCSRWSLNNFYILC